MQINVTIQGPEGPHTLRLKGRLAWTLSELEKAGTDGISSLRNPAPRLSHYVMCLRRKGIGIDTVREKHGGSYPGVHGIYRLTSVVEIEREAA